MATTDHSAGMFSYRMKPEEESSRPKRKIWPIIIIGGLAFVVAILVGFIVFALLWIESDHILPGVTCYGVDLGRGSISEGVEALQHKWDDRPINLEVGGATWLVSPADIGMALDAENTMRQAHLQGRSLRSLDRWLANERRTEIQPVWYFHPDQAESYLRILAPQLFEPATDASVQIVDGHALALHSELGKRLDVEATMASLTKSPAQVLESRRMTLLLAQVNPAIIDASKVAQAINQMLDQTLVLEGYDPIENRVTELLIRPEDWNRWLLIDVLDAEEGRFSWNLDYGLARAHLIGLSHSLGQGHYLDTQETLPVITNAIEQQAQSNQVRIYHSDTHHTTQPGETLSSIGRHYGIPYPWIQEANPGIGEQLAIGQDVTIPSADNLLPLPVIRGKRIVVSISRQRVQVFEGGGLKWDWPASTGINESPTSPGVFQIQSHETNAYANSWDLWMPYFMGVYRPVPSSSFMNGFHGFPTRGGSNLLWTGNLGSKVTYGCILISTENAAALYNWAEEGVIVEIRS
jgi:lipoprotein-anchoring transpeptidase ErfK/SrfK